MNERMNAVKEKGRPASTLMVVIAFAIVYIVWGSTYFFIQKAIHGFPPFLLGAHRFLASGILMLAWCLFTGQKIGGWKEIRPSLITGFLLLFVGNGSVIWAEQFLPSALVAILISSAPISFVLLDKPKWKENFRSPSTIAGLVVGFAGVVLLFFRNIQEAFSATGNGREIGGMALVLFGSMCWAGGSLYSKYNSKGPAVVNSSWQMLIAGFIFLLCGLARGEHVGFSWSEVSLDAWLSVAYLVFFGSIAAFSAYVWLLNVRPATQVSTYAYVNPVIAVLLGVFLASESITSFQILGLGIILFSVLLINLVAYKKDRNKARREVP